jgi:hypothetical protein
MRTVLWTLDTIMQQLLCRFYTLEIDLYLDGSCFCG